MHPAWLPTVAASVRIRSDSFTLLYEFAFSLCVCVFVRVKWMIRAGALAPVKVGCGLVTPALTFVFSRLTHACHIQSKRATCHWRIIVKQPIVRQISTMNIYLLPFLSLFLSSFLSFYYCCYDYCCCCCWCCCWWMGGRGGGGKTKEGCECFIGCIWR